VDSVEAVEDAVELEEEVDEDEATVDEDEEILEVDEDDELEEEAGCRLKSRAPPTTAASTTMIKTTAAVTRATAARLPNEEFFTVLRKLIQVLKTLKRVHALSYEFSRRN